MGATEAEFAAAEAATEAAGYQNTRQWLTRVRMGMEGATEAEFAAAVATTIQARFETVFQMGTQNHEKTCFR